MMKGMILTLSSVILTLKNTIPSRLFPITTFSQTRFALLASEEFSCSLHKSISLPTGVSVESIAFSPAETFFAMGTSSGCIQLWNPLTASIRNDLPFQNKKELMHHDADSAILCLAFF